MRRRWHFAVGVLAAVALLEPWAPAGVSAQAGTSLFVSEVHPGGSGNGSYNADWFEVTNAGFSTVTISGWKVDDSSNSFAAAVPLNGVTSIAPGQSVVFVDASVPVDLNAFAAAWFGSSIPPTLTIGTYGGSGIGLSTGGDAINLFDAGGNRITGVSFGSATANVTFDNAAGLGGTTLPLPVVATVSAARVNGAFLSANGAETGSPGRRRLAAPLSTVDLSTYVRVGRFDLPEPTRTTPPVDSVLAQEVSGVTFNWDTDTLFVVGDGGTSVVQVTRTGQLIDSMTLVPGTSPQGTEFYDPEGLAYVGGGKFVMVEERDRQFVEFTYVPGGRLTRADTRTVKLGTFVDNTGIEGLTYDPSTGRFLAVKETQPQGLFETGVDFAAGTATNGSPTATNSTNLFDFTEPFAGLLDFADIYALSNLPSLEGPDATHLLVLSQESGKILNIDRQGTVSSSLTILSDPGNPLTVPSQQHEGLAMDGNGFLYVVSENGGGDFDHPQLWVYAPSLLPNQAPAALALTDQVNTLPENSSTVARLKVANVVITDDGLGVNDLTVTGGDAGAFEVDSTGLYVKAGVALDFETKNSYAVTVAVDDAAVGSTPDATAGYALTLTDVGGETPAPSSLVITEVAPWSSGNSPVAADWFEVTNTGAAAVNIAGWRIDDSSNALAASVALTGVTVIAPGESVIFLETDNLAATAAVFRSTWFGSSPPAALQIGSYSGGGVGLSTGGDAVNLFDAGGARRAGVTFGVAPAAAPFATFDNGVGLDGAAISTLSAVGVRGAFAAAGNPAEVGSPGTTGPAARLIISEVAPWSSGNSPVGADWFEITNVGGRAISLTGWKVDDSSESPAAAVALNGVASIAPGESVIFLETDNLAATAAVFRSTWFGSNPPAALQIGSYSGGGIGLSTGGDAVNLYDAGGVLRAKVFFGPSPTGPAFPSFDNGAGLNNAAITQLSVAGVTGAFRALDTLEVGSPGSIAPDTVPPLLAPLPDIATSTTTSTAVVTFAAPATDNVSHPAHIAVSCQPASGTAFPIGTTTVACTAQDEAGNVSAPVTFAVTVQLIVSNRAPVAGPDSASTLEGEPVAIPVLANDSDPDGDSVTILSIGSPAHGSATIGAAGIVYTPAADFHGTDTFFYVLSDGRGGTGVGQVTVSVSRLGRFVALSRDMTWLRAGATAITGDVGALERRAGNHRSDVDPEDGRDDVTVRIGVGASLQQPSSRVVGDTVLLLNRSSIHNLVDNVLLARRNSTVLGTTTSPMVTPFAALPVFPSIQAGPQKITVAKNKTATLAPGAYSDVQVGAGGTLILTGGLYQLASIDLDKSASLVFRGATEIRVKTSLQTRAKAKLILDPAVPGLTASQVAIYVAGRDEDCGRAGADDDGDDAGPVAAHIGAQSVVPANIYANRGTIWLKSRTQATGAFIGLHVRVGVDAQLTLDSAFK